VFLLLTSSQGLRTIQVALVTCTIQVALVTCTNIIIPF